MKSQPAVGFALGVCSGWPLMLVTTVAQMHWTVAGYSTAEVASLSLLSWPYLLKWLWAQALDMPGFLKSRRAWVMVLLTGVVLMTLVTALIPPPCSALTLMGLALASATLDAAIDGYKVAFAEPSGYAWVASASMQGYRIANLLSGGGLLMLTAWLGWQQLYALAGLALLPWLMWLPTIPACELGLAPGVSWKPWVRIQQLLGQPMLWLWLLCYRLPDGLLSDVVPVLFVRVLHLSPALTGALYKGVGLVASMVGGVGVGWRIHQVSLRRGLIEAGIAQSLAIAAYVLMLRWPLGQAMIAWVVALECLAAGMCAGALVTWMMHRTSPSHAAGDFAILTALAMAAKVLLGPVAGLMAQNLGWGAFLSVLGVVSLWPWLYLVVNPSRILEP